MVRYALATCRYVIFSSDNGAWIDPGTGLGNLTSKPLEGGSNAPFRYVCWLSRACRGCAAHPV